MGIAPRSDLCHKPRRLRNGLWGLTAALGLVLSSACGAPAIVDGIVEDSQFSIRDVEPEVRQQPDDGLIIVIAEEAGAELRVVQLKLPPLAEHQAGDVIEIGPREDGGAWLTAANGTLEAMVRSDGVRVLNTTDARIAHAAFGEVVCDTEDGFLTGTLTAQLEDGGWVDGTFVAPLD